MKYRNEEKSITWQHLLSEGPLHCGQLVTEADLAGLGCQCTSQPWQIQTNCSGWCENVCFQLLMEHHSIGIPVSICSELQICESLTCWIEQIESDHIKGRLVEAGASCSLITSWKLTGFPDAPQIHPAYLCTNELSWRSGLLMFKWVYLAHCSIYLNDHYFGALKLNVRSESRWEGRLWHWSEEEDIWNTSFQAKIS